MATPEADLGVVATPVEVDQPTADPLNDTLILDDTGQGSDLPVLDSADDTPSSGDLPALGQEAPEPIEPEAEPDDGN